uniref:Mg-protoporphyrin IX methyl transferase n=1 Tax=Paulinella micropora TaxID=1928728 RepID=A0A385I033_9EUKA|nr:Mg-protoporphyrin IX methyl transferase [Paulinella micropora]AXY63272.1 Mg-protoporphyrin IX methyl transferase [Paulinella micropora]
MNTDQRFINENQQNFTKETMGKVEVTEYFNSTGFDRWKRIYSDTSDINKVQKNIRVGHKKMVDQVLTWLQEKRDLSNHNICDAGCGVGSLTLPLVQLGVASITASDISESMTKEVERRAEAANINVGQIIFRTSDLENIEGTFEDVICLDVFMHYEQYQAERMVRLLASKALKTLIVSFSPYTPFLEILKAIGQFFPGSSKTTRAYLLKEEGIIKAAKDCGFQVKRSNLNKAPFYFSKLIEFERT